MGRLPSPARNCVSLPPSLDFGATGGLRYKYFGPTVPGIGDSQSSSLRECRTRQTRVRRQTRITRFRGWLIAGRCWAMKKENMGMVERLKRWGVEACGARRLRLQSAIHPPSLRFGATSGPQSWSVAHAASAPYCGAECTKVTIITLCRTKSLRCSLGQCR